MVERLTGCMTKYFGFSSFRTGQKEAASSALHGRDVFVRMATGGGKSLSMFLVPLTYSNEAVGVIISPLNSLMEEQVSLCSVVVFMVSQIGRTLSVGCFPQPLPLKHRH